MEIVLVISLIINLVTGYIIWNVNKKLVKQEEVIESQVDYLRKVSYIITESNLYIEKLDERGTLRSDDEIGTFFNFMKEIQETINAFRLPEDYGKN
jgi:hypothetical protein